VSRFDWHGLEHGLRDFPNVRRWYEAIRLRPAVQRGYDVPKMGNEIPAA
jgi:glutathione S-transferase